MSPYGMRFHTPTLVGVVTAPLLTAASHAGVVVGSGTASVWGQAAPFQTWDITGDVSGGFALPFEAIPFGMGFHDGRLYIANRGEFRYGPGFTYTPGPTGQLVAASTLRSSGVPNNDPLRFTCTQSFAFNTGGQGFGAGSAFISLQQPDNVPSPLTAVSFAPSGTSFTPASRSQLGGVPRDLDYVASTDRFVGVSSFQGSFTARVVTYSHTATGLTELPGGFDLGLTDKSIAVVSGAFASGLLGQPVADAQVLIVAGAPTDAGFANQLELSVRTLSGVEIGSRQVVADIGIPSVKAISVDEASGLLYLGGTDQFQLGRGYITALSIPAPGVLAALGLAGAVSRRRVR